MQAVLDTDRRQTVSLTANATNLFEHLSVINSFRHVGQLVVYRSFLPLCVDDFRVITMATELGYATIGDIASAPIGPEDLGVDKEPTESPTEERLVLFNGALKETLTCTRPIEFDPGKVDVFCKHLRTDRIGIICSTCRSVGRFRKEYDSPCPQTETVNYGEFSEGTVVAVTVVWIGVRDGRVEIF